MSGVPSRCPLPRERGFTLVEMLVSLALLGFFAVLVSAGVGAAHILTLRQRVDDAEIGSVAAAQALLRTRIERLRAVRSVQSAEMIVALRGTATTFDFIGDPPDRQGADALQHYRLLRTAAGDVVLLGLNGLDARVDPQEPQTIGWTPVRLATGTSALSIHYYGAAPLGGPAGWQSLWVDRRQPPDLVRISVEFPQRDRRLWPDLVIRPRATINSACRLDPATGRCAVAT